MEALFKIDWPGLLVPKLSLAEMIVRGVVTYIALCLLLRVVLRRQAGKMALSDLLVITLVAGVCRNPLIVDAYSLPDGIGVVMVILGCSYAADWLSYHSRFIHEVLHPAPVLLVRDGQIQTPNLRKQLMTELRLMSKLRQHGIADLSEVTEAWLEGDGRVSVIRRKTSVPDHAVEGRGSQAPVSANGPGDTTGL